MPGVGWFNHWAPLDPDARSAVTVATAVNGARIVRAILLRDGPDGGIDRGPATMLLI
jgi:hypothetical protein